jgi:transcriptional regulator with XRE-family HTH domain
VTDLDGELTELLRDMRHQAGLTQDELASRLGRASRSNISHYETGKTPQVETIGRWAAACGFHAELRILRPNGVEYMVVSLNDGPQP